MQPIKLLHKTLTNARAIGHQQRQASLLHAVDSVLHGGKLNLTCLGRRMQKPIKPKSKIQAINYLLGNGQLVSERCGIYKAVNRWLSNQTTLTVLVDWSSIVAHQYHLLRASVVVKGRSLVVWEERHPESLLGNEQVQGDFLKRLKACLPKGAAVCIVTDAGFHVNFFIQVVQLGWDYVGRLLTMMHYTPTEKACWKPCSSLYAKATRTPQAIGPVRLRKKNPFDAYLYLYQAKQPNAYCNGGKKRRVKYARHEKKHKNAANKPWLIASSLDVIPKAIITRYKLRMKIEHEFRDVKDPRWGIGLRESRSQDPMRLTLQLLVGMLALFLLWLIGLCLEDQKLHRDFQANSIRHKRVLSLVFLALEAIQAHYLKKLTYRQLILTLKGAFDEHIGQIM